MLPFVQVSFMSLMHFGIVVCERRPIICGHFMVKGFAKRR